jgi:glycosyltransferase involved in cell wall biosynthesis
MISFHDIKQRNFENILHSVLKDASRILDLGCGIGDYLRQTNSSQYVVGVDPHLPYVEKAKDRVPWATVFNTDGISYLKESNEQFDCILLIDVLEHLEPDDAIQLVEEAKKHCKGIILSQIPIGVHQQHHDAWNMGGEFWQTHRSTWDAETVQQLGFDHVFLWKDYYTWYEEAEHKSQDTSVAVWTVEKFPLVSVVVPSYNQTEWLPKTLDSIIAQSYPFWEAVVVNDGSTDNTKEVIGRYEEQDARIRGVHKENGGISSALNAGIDNAKGKYFCWLSSDDLFYPNKLELQIKEYEHCDANTAIVFGEFDHVDPDDNITPLEHTKPYYDGLEFPQFLKYDYVDGCTIMIPMRMMREVCGFNVQFKHAQDTELWFRLAAKGYSFHYLPTKLTCRRIHPNQGFKDFELDCRFDGLWMVDYYLSRYSFRDFYRNVDFADEAKVHDFMLHMFMMLIDSNCNINHPVLNEKYWQWLSNGLRTLPLEVCSTIFRRAIAYFKDKEHFGEFVRTITRTFIALERSLRNKKHNTLSQARIFHDITLWDKSTDRDFTERLFEYGEDMLKIGNTAIGTGVFKYLSDIDNLYCDEAFKRFYALTFLQGKYDPYLRSFKRKPNFAQLPDNIKASYVWAQIELHRPHEEIDRVVALINDAHVLRKIEEWKSHSVHPLSFDEITQWNFGVEEFSIRHSLDILCGDCKQEYSSSVRFDFAPTASSTKILCPHCLSVSIFSDEYLANYFLKQNASLVSTHRSQHNTPNVAVVMRYSNIIGGGVKKMLQHAEWLEKLGCKVTVYSDAPAPAWRKVPGKFVPVSNHYEVPPHVHDAVVCMCIYDVPKMLTKYPKEHVALFCQGYEGYHIGRTYDELRSDKHFYTAVHSLTANKFVISHHLVKLFKDKFGDDSSYVPNGVAHSVFYPNLKLQKESNSILFIGNPNDPLKGLIFLTKTLQEIQKSEFHIDGLTLHVVFGGVGKKEVKHIQIPGYEVQYHEGLSSIEIAQLINRAELVVNTSWYEGFSLPVLEALACGTPVVTTNNMGAESFCVDEKNAFVLKYGDMNRLGNIVIDVLGHKRNVSEMILNGLLTAQEYSEEHAVKKFIEEYAKFLRVEFQKNKIERLVAEASGNNSSAHSVIRHSESNRPLFSILVPTYNQAEFLPDALESLRVQSFSNWEAIVVNDGSTDDTKNVLERFAMFDKRIRIFHKENGGVATALNEALKQAKGNWICWLSSDDLFEPDKLKIHFDEFQKRPNAKFYHTLYYGLNHATGQKVRLGQSDGRFLPPKEDQVISFFYTNYVNGISICAHRSVFDVVGSFNPALRNGQDFDMWLRIAGKFPFDFIEKRTCTYRVHTNQGASKFPEAGEYDSSLACAEYLNAHTFAELFPFVDLRAKANAVRAIEKTIAVAVDEKSFINRLGFGRLMIERLHEWISNDCSLEFRNELNAALQPGIQEILRANVSQDTKDAFAQLSNAGKDSFVFNPHNVIASAQAFGAVKATTVSEKEAQLLFEYLARIPQTDLTPTSEHDRLGTVIELLHRKQYQQVLQELDRFIEIPSAIAEDVYSLQGYAYLGLQNIEKAKSCFETALQANPNSSAACTGLGEVFYLSELDEQAKTMFEWAIKNDPSNRAAAGGLKKINLQLGLPQNDNSLIAVDLVREDRLAGTEST